MELSSLEPSDFDSSAQFDSFVEYVAKLDEKHQKRMCSIVGRPSQFVGPVRTLQQAIEHWRQWDIWDKEERLRQAQVRLFVAGEEAPVLVPMPPSTVDQQEVDKLNAEWRAAIAWARDNKTQWDDWKRQEAERVRVTYEEADRAREAHVRVARDAYRAAKNKS